MTKRGDWRGCMKVLKKEYGETPFTEWLFIKLKEYHKEKYGEDSEIIVIEDQEIHSQKGA